MIVENLLSNLFFQNSLCIFRRERILNQDHIHNLRVFSFMFNILKHKKIPTLRSSLNISYPSHSNYTRNSNNIFSPYPMVAAFRKNFRYQFIKVCLEMHALTDIYISLKTRF